MLRRSFALALCLAATSVAAGTTACSTESLDDAEQTDDEILGGATALSLVKDLPLDTTWAGLSPSTRAKLEAAARKTERAYERQWDERALREQVRRLEVGATPEATAAFDQYVRDVFGAFLAAPDAYAASTAMSPALRGALRKLYVVRVAAWRLNVLGYANMQPLEVDGVTRIDQFPLPNERVIAAYQKVAADAVGELRAALAGQLSDEERALADRALFHARTHAAGSTGFRYGSQDLLTVWGRGGWAYDLAFLRGEPGGKFLQDDERYAETINAYYLEPLRHADRGTVGALPNLVEMLIDPEFVKGELGADPATNAAAKAYYLQTKWFLERAQASRDAQKACDLFTDAERAAMWEGFSADNLFNHDGASSLATFRGEAAASADQDLALYRKVLVDAVKAFAAEKGLTAAQVAAVETAVNAEARYGAIATAAATALDATGAGNGAAFTAKLSDIPSVGGYAAGEALRPADRAVVDRVYADVKAFLASAYGLDVAKLPATVNVKPDANSTVTGQDGTITFGLKTARTENWLVRVMLHEVHHSWNSRGGVFVEGPAWEGAATVTEARVFPTLLTKVLTARGEAAKAAYWLANNYANRNALIAKTDATVSILLRNECGSKDTVQFARDIGAKWGLADEAALADVAVRAHHGTSYLQYTAGEILYTGFLDRLGAAVGQPLDPFQLQACGLAFAPENAATVTALKACLTK